MQKIIFSIKKFLHRDRGNNYTLDTITLPLFIEFLKNFLKQKYRCL